jgi:predicted nuclease of predicted toxin-antitoxin system
VLKRDGIIHDVPEAAIEDFLDCRLSISNLVPFVLRRRPSLRDAADERILEVAVQCGAIIVTHNRKDFEGAGRLGVVLQTPAEFLRMLRERE